MVLTYKHIIIFNYWLNTFLQKKKVIYNCIFKYILILVARASQDLMLFMKTHQVNPIKGMVLPAIQVI